MSRYQHGFFLPSLATPPYSPLLLAGLPGYIQYRHRAGVCMFELDVQPLLVTVKGSTGVYIYIYRCDAWSDECIGKKLVVTKCC